MSTSMEELREIVADIAREQRELAREQRELTREQQRTDAMVRETDRQIKETNRQLGALGNTLGSYTESLMYPSIEKILRERFGVTHFTQRARGERDGKRLEIDVLGYRPASENDPGVAFVVEVKVKFGEDELEQITETLEMFPRVFVDHADKPLYGMVAAVTIPENMRRRVQKAGLYLLTPANELFDMKLAERFSPRDYRVRLRKV